MKKTRKNFQSLDQQISHSIFSLQLVKTFNVHNLHVCAWNHLENCSDQKSWQFLLSKLPFKTFKSQILIEKQFSLIGQPYIQLIGNHIQSTSSQVTIYNLHLTGNHIQSPPSQVTIYNLHLTGNHIQSPPSHVTIYNLHPHR